MWKEPERQKEIETLILQILTRDRVGDVAQGTLRTFWKSKVKHLTMFMNIDMTYMT